MNEMLRKCRSLRFFILFFLLGSFIPLFTADYTENEVCDTQELFTNPIYKSTNKKDNSLDLLVMFNQEIPNLEPFNSLIATKYTKFPVIRIIFNTSTMKHLFFKNYQEKIYQIEPNKVLRSSFHIVPENSQESSVTKVTIQDATSASFLHQLNINGSRTKIGIVDTGVSDHFEEFGTRIKGREVFVTKDNDYSDDISSVVDNWGHGTHVAGLAAGANTGIAPGAEIYSAKVIHSMDVQGAGDVGGEETTAGLLKAIEYLVNNSVDVINISLGQYHNLPSGLRDEVINYVSIIHNIVFSVSVGNSGTSLGDRGTLNNPSTALQCIAVSASDTAGTYIANFASKGPKVDYSLKPDITAPGISISGPRREGSGYTTKSGTSMAAPIVAGAAALLIDYLKSKNLNYSAATIKAALLAGVRTLGKPIWEEGAGFVNITRSWEILNSAEKINNTPDLVYLHPQKLPFDPYEVLFNNSSIVFNLTVISSRNLKTNINISKNISNFVNTSSSSYIINNTTLLPVNFTIPALTEAQLVLGNVKINNQTLKVEFEIRETVINVLFDEGLNKIVRHGRGTTAYEIQGDSSNTIGMYSAFTRFLAYENNYSVTPHVKGEFTLTELLQYDVLILANPLSNSTDIYMDWANDPNFEYISLSEGTKEAISQFVETGGGLLILNTNDDDYYNIAGLNDFLELFGLQIQTEHSENIRTSTIVNPQNFTTSITSFPFYGNYIQTSGDYTQVIAEYNGYPTLASYENPNGGRVLLFGSDLIFDNIGISSNKYPGNSTENRILAFNSVSWLAEAEGKFIETTTSIPEFPYSLIFLVLIISLGIIYILFITRTKR